MKIMNMIQPTASTFTLVPATQQQVASNPTLQALVRTATKKVESANDAISAAQANREAFALCICAAAIANQIPFFSLSERQLKRFTKPTA